MISPRFPVGPLGTAWVSRAPCLRPSHCGAEDPGKKPHHWGDVVIMVLFTGSPAFESKLAKCLFLNVTDFLQGKS